MIFFFKKPTIIIDCFTNRVDVDTYAPVDYSNKFYPQWWKDTPGTIKKGFIEEATIKQCQGFIDYYQKGIMIPMWTDLKVHLTPIGETRYSWAFSDARTGGQIHDEPQRGSFLPPTEYSHLKIMSPWLFRCKDDIQWYYTGNVWESDPANWFVLPGIIDFKYQNATNINLMFIRGEERTVTIEFGKPLVHLLPLTDKKVKIVRHLVDDKEYSRIEDMGTTIKFIGKYRTMKNIMSNKGKCPFGFGK